MPEGETVISHFVRFEIQAATDTMRGVETNYDPDGMISLEGPGKVRYECK